jgi:hypothetical protein
MTPATRPANVPEAASWSEDDGEWILAPRDGEGRLDGLMVTWREDGTLASESPHVRGEEHGEARRFHESGEVSRIATYKRGKLHGLSVWFASDKRTSERMHALGMSREIARSEVDYAYGGVVRIRHFDREGRRVNTDGTPLLEPPRKVSRRKK